MSASAAKTLALDRDALLASAAPVVTAKRELRVLQVFSVLSVGGAETWLMSLLRYFNEHAEGLPVRVKVDILLTGGEPSVFDEEAKELGARLFYLRFTRRNAAHFSRQFRRLLASGNYDVIHDHQDYIAGLHFLLGLGHLPPIRIAHVHSALRHRADYANDRVRATSMSTGRRMLGRLATHVLGTSQKVIDEYGFSAPQYRAVGVLNCGFDPSRMAGEYSETHAEVCREFGWDQSARIILFAGRLDGEAIVNGRTVSQKNVEFALEIAKECFARDDKTRLVIAGSGDLHREKELNARVNAWGYTERVRILTGPTDLPKLLVGSDVMLFTSPAEGLGMIVVEAQAAGLPVLASDTTPRECSVIPGRVKFLSLDLGASAWADEVEHLMKLGHSQTQERFEAISRSQFSIENSATNLLKIYSGAVS